MQNLAISALMTAAATAVAAFSPSARTPSRNPCMVRVEQKRYRNDPYLANVISTSPMVVREMMQTTHAPSMVELSMYDYAATAMSHYATAAPLVRPVAPAPVALQSSPTKEPVTHFAYVDFKHECAVFVAPFRIAAGDHVVVEGDRGENIGVVAKVTTDAPQGDTQRKVVRRATGHDMEQLREQRLKEETATAACQKAAKTLGLRATVVDTEYQFDMNKLTIFVRRPSRNAFVDFRKLQRGLFHNFRCRIWLVYMDEVEEANSALFCANEC